MVPRVCIKEAQGFAPQGQVDYLIYAWQRKQILRACLIEAGVVNTHSPFPAFLFYKNGIGQPLWVVYFLDETGNQELSDFFADEPPLLLVEAAQALFDQPRTQHDLQGMLGDFP